MNGWRADIANDDDDPPPSYFAIGLVLGVCRQRAYQLVQQALNKLGNGKRGEAMLALYHESESRQRAIGPHRKRRTTARKPSLDWYDRDPSRFGR